MRSRVYSAFLVGCLGCLACALALSACGSAGASAQHGASSASNEYRLTDCNAAAEAQSAPARRHLAASASVYVSEILGSVIALAADDGAQQWCVHIKLVRYTYNCPPGAHCPGPPVARVGQPLIADGMAFVCASGGADGVMFAFNAADGALRWSQATGCISSDGPYVDDAQPILVGGVLYTGADGLDPATGAVRWRLPSALAPDSICAVADGMVYVYDADTGDTIIAVRLANGAVVWSTELTGEVSGRPLIEGGTLYIGDFNGGGQVIPPPPNLPDMYALNAYTGAVQWQSPTGPVWSAAALGANGLLYISATTLDALDPATGAIRWRSHHTVNTTQTALVPAPGVIYYVDDGAYAVDTGAETVRWHVTLDPSHSSYFVGPSLYGGALYVAGVNGSGQSILYALDAATGAVLWQRGGFDQLTAPTV